ncbi:hypothetical protein BMS3Abin03_00282 [bacterium BMS3Abin03]|nr:hypothetical protein BMS3Abin03_00282 [bacterium BMS3Abin03]
MKENEIECTNCGSVAEQDSDYCPRCGALFIDNVFCVNHKQVEAAGICLICSEPFCEKCGHSVSNVFICNPHAHYEIYEGMAKVYGTSDEIQIHFVKNCLEEESLHPFIFSRKSSPMHLGGTDYSLFRASGDYNGHLINELKLMVPCSEVLQSEEIIARLEL